MIKRTLFTLALIGAAAVSYGQGTIAFQNTIAARAVLVVPGVSTNSVPTTAGLINYGVFWGTAANNLALATGPLGANSTSSAGIIAGGASSVYAIPGALEGSTYFLQIKGWDATFGSDWTTAMTQGAWYGETDVRQVTMAPSAGPGTVIWQGSTGTSPNRFYPLQLIAPIPEPSSFALAGLGAAALLIFRRRK